MNEIVFAASPGLSERRNLYLRRPARTQSQPNYSVRVHNHTHTHTYYILGCVLSPRAFITSSRAATAIIVSMNKLKRTTYYCMKPG